MSYVADAVINSPRPKLEIQEQSDRITFADDIPTNYLDDAVPVSYVCIIEILIKVFNLVLHHLVNHKRFQCV